MADLTATASSCVVAAAKMMEALQIDGVGRVPSNVPDVIDVRATRDRGNLAETIIESLSTLRASDGLRSIPTMVLYDNRGLQLFDQITRVVGEYYLTAAEIDVLENHIQDIIRYVPDESAVIELGAGSLMKTSIILRALEDTGKRVTYYALDLDERELVRALNSLGTFRNVKTYGLLGTYEEGIAWVAKCIPAAAPKALLWLGSSIGNLDRAASAEFLRSVQETCMNPGDILIVGADRRNDPQRIATAYNDPAGITEKFIMNGLDHVNTIFRGGQGKDAVIDRQNFSYDAYYNEAAGRHEAYYKSLKAQTIRLSCGQRTAEIHLKKGERVHVEYSHKYSHREIMEIFNCARLIRFGVLTDSKSEYDLHLCQKPPFWFSTRSTPSETFSAVPALEDWEELWKAWDFVTQKMIRREDLLERPIGLRHPFIFYRGHIPGFLDLQLSRCLCEKFRGPPQFEEIFERGIDPDVDDPSVCHDHSRVPSQWPPVDEIDDFMATVRDRVREILRKDEWKANKRLARVLWMCFEHEAMHMETIMYMIVQFERALPPPTIHRPLWQNPEKPAPEASFVLIPRAIISIGHEDPENLDLDASAPFPAEFGWDNERPSRALTVPAFEVQSRSVTNGEYASFLEGQKNALDFIPRTWTAAEDGSFRVRTVFGPVPLSVAINWPVSVSVVQAEAYATWKGARLPTEAELSAVRHLHHAPHPADNYGFRSWAPLPVTSCPAGENLGIVSDGWEITSTVWESYIGFQASELYHGYSKDFFDGKHMVLLGASWTTHPRIAERSSFRNWYHCKYGYMFSSFRLARSVPA